METEYLITVEEFCASYDIEIIFIISLQEAGLIEITTIETTGFLNSEQLKKLDRYIRFYYELNINFEGIEAIEHLLHRVNDVQLISKIG